MTEQSFGNVFDAISRTPAEAANLKARAELLSVLESRIAGWNVSQDEAARRLGITRPRVNDLLRGKLAKFSLDALVNLTAAAGLTLVMSVAEAA